MSIPAPRKPSALDELTAALKACEVETGLQIVVRLPPPASTRLGRWFARFRHKRAWYFSSAGWNEDKVHHSETWTLYPACVFRYTQRLLLEGPHVLLAMEDAIAHTYEVAGTVRDAARNLRLLRRADAEILQLLGRGLDARTSVP